MKKPVMGMVIISILILVTSVCGCPYQEYYLPDSDNDAAGINSNVSQQNQTQVNNTENSQGTDQNQGNSQQGTTQNKQTTSTQTTKQNTQTTSQTPTKTTTTTTAPAAHTHTWVTQYVGYDSVKEKIRYKVYCSKCGEVSGYVWY